MNKKIFAVALLVAFALPAMSFAQSMTTAQVQAEIQMLLGQLQILQSKAAASGSVSATASGSTSGSANGWCYSFTGNLGVGSTGPAVTALQQALVNNGENVSVVGRFGPQTQAAVLAFQAKYAAKILTPAGLTYGTGYVGAGTRAELNALFGCGEGNGSTGTTTTQPPMIPVPPPVSTGSGTGSTNTGVTTSAPAIITGISPVSGAIGTTVTLTGSGFGPTDTILFNGQVNASGVASSNGETLTFTVSGNLRPNCAAGSMCPDYIALLGPGTYSVSVLTNGMVSNSISFMVTGAGGVTTTMPIYPL